jgi:transcriptional regulator with XRE-family HTH domain
MAIRRRRADVGEARGRELVALVGREFLAGRTNAGLSQDEVGPAAGMSRAQYGRIERGIAPEVSVASIARIAAVLGLDASLRFYPSADPVRDAAHLALLQRLRATCHPSLIWRTEVPFPRSGDLRAWDAVIGLSRAVNPGRPFRIGVEAETRPMDAQALDRKLALKERDGDADRMILLLADTRHNRSFVRGSGASLRIRFPLDGRRAVQALTAGLDPGANSLVVL